MSARSASGSEVRQSRMIRTVSVNESVRIGSPVPAVRMTASTTFRALNKPPKNEPPSIKFGGIT